MASSLLNTTHRDLEEQQRLLEACQKSMVALMDVQEKGRQEAQRMKRGELACAEELAAGSSTVKTVTER
eukprot:760432-Amphidinium_carterae.1